MRPRMRRQNRKAKGAAGKSAEQKTEWPVKDLNPIHWFGTRCDNPYANKPIENIGSVREDAVADHAQGPATGSPSVPSERTACAWTAKIGGC